MENKHSGIKPTCHEVHRLSSERMDRPLSTLERTRVAVHLALCKACRTFDQQLALLRQAMHQMPLIDEPPANAKKEQE